MAAETRLVPSFTGYQITMPTPAEKLIYIRTQYDGPNCVEYAFIVEEPRVINGVPFLEGELCVVMCSETDFALDSNGNLIAWSQSNEVNHYQVDSNGNLIYYP